MTRVELVKQLLRARTLLALAALAAIPVVLGLATASDAGHRNGDQEGLYGAAPFSALNHAAAGLQFTAPLLLALIWRGLGLGHDVDTVAHLWLVTFGGGAIVAFPALLTTSTGHPPKGDRAITGPATKPSP